VSTSHPPHATHGSLRMTLVVEAPGIPAYTHDFSKFAVRVDKWPSPGDVLPVEVDPGDLGRVEVLWDEIPTVRDAARGEAERMAAMLRQQETGVPGQDPQDGAAGGVAGIVGQLQQMFPGAVVNVEGDHVVPGPVEVVADRSDADPVERLEKLARLRDAGVVDQAQFEQLKAQILGQAGLDNT
jgi:putative oligomerization/nucleic acid binding protein